MLSTLCQQASNYETTDDLGTTIPPQWIGTVSGVTFAQKIRLTTHINYNVSAGHIVTTNKSVVAHCKPDNAQGRFVLSRWIFSGVDLTTKHFFMELIAQWDAATLIPIIQQTILPGTRIWSDKREAYNNLNQLGYGHQMFSHKCTSYCFILLVYFYMDGYVESWHVLLCKITLQNYFDDKWKNKANKKLNHHLNSDHLLIHWNQ